MRKALLTLALCAGAALGADLKVTGPDEVKAHKLIRLDAAGADPAAGLDWDVAEYDLVDVADGAQGFVFTAPPGLYHVTLREILVKDGKTTIRKVRKTVTVTGATPPAPVPPGPNPPGPTPAPEPLTSFRVVLVFESADALTLEQKAVVFGKPVEAYLNANCTGGAAGWRRRDKDSPGEQDKTMAALWAAVQPKVTVVPCVAVERNGKVEIINLEPTPAAMVATFTRYREGK